MYITYTPVPCKSVVAAAAAVVVVSKKLSLEAVEWGTEHFSVGQNLLNGLQNTCNNVINCQIGYCLIDLISLKGPWHENNRVNWVCGCYRTKRKLMNKHYWFIHYSSNRLPSVLTSDSTPPSIPNRPHEPEGCSEAHTYPQKSPRA